MNATSSSSEIAGKVANVLGAKLDDIQQLLQQQTKMPTNAEKPINLEKSAPPDTRGVVV